MQKILTFSFYLFVGNKHKVAALIVGDFLHQNKVEDGFNLQPGTDEGMNPGKMH